MNDERDKAGFLLVQADLRWADAGRNRAHLQSLIEPQAATADVIVLPETFSTGFLGDHGNEAEPMDGPTVQWMAEQAERHGAVITGSLAIEDDGRRNRLLWVEPGGRISHYDKKHLFSYGGEDQRYAAGKEQVVIQYRGWRIRPLICYDIRFPVWCRHRGDYDMLLVVANWPSARVSAWTALLRARAIENQCYVVAVNRVGRDGNGLPYNGHSVVFDPFGEALAELGEEESTALVALDSGHVRQVREKLPFQADGDGFSLIA